ncbi:MAG: phosphatidylinositol kinase [Cycloclasticus sp. symbiont of Poecilosclerida sp. N]|nr:MAG: phosphatidylinositol kinase [Cycloclasticus sp. symbiont of Poecilosclerida sp. N]
MTSKNPHEEAYVWIWLSGEVKPVIAGKLTADGTKLFFNYGKSYIERMRDASPAIPIYEPELPLRTGVLPLLDGLNMPGCIRDGAPDAWGRRVITNKKLGVKGADTAVLDELTYLLESGSDRIGTLDFQLSATSYEPRSAKNASLEELIGSAARVEKGVPLTAELDAALYHGTAIGGARPKALIEDGDKKYIAKFSSSTDVYNVVKAEFVAMKMAEVVGLDAAAVQLKIAAGKDVLLIERFDRTKTPHGWARKSMVSALTLFALDDMMARYASYEDLAEIIRYRFSDPKNNLKELFSRLTYNVLCGNTDDHARNHSAFWDGETLSLTPAYDICPQGRSGNEASHAMLISGNNNLSQLKTCLAAAHSFLISKQDARAIFEHQIELIELHWDSVCDEAQLSEIDRKLLFRRQFLNPYSVLINP